MGPTEIGLSPADIRYLHWQQFKHRFREAEILVCFSVSVKIALNF